MIFTKVWLNQYVDVLNLSTDDLCVKLNQIGLEVDSLNQIRLDDNIVIGKVISKQKHPNANKLNICMVDVGDKSSEPLQIICGAKNVEQDIFVAVSLIGALLPNGLKIKQAKLRDVDSFGMICSSSELGLGEVDEGIMILDDSVGELVLGRALNEYDIFNDDIIELELTANRGDALNVFAIAKEVHTAFDMPLHKYTLNPTTSNKSIKSSLKIEFDENIPYDLTYKLVDKSNIKLNLHTKLLLSYVKQYTNDNFLNALNYGSHCMGVLYDCYEYKDKLFIKLDNDGICNVYDENSQILSKPLIKQALQTTSDLVIVEASYYHCDDLNLSVFNSKELKNKDTKSDIYFKSSRGSNFDLNLGMNFLQEVLNNCGCVVYSGAFSNINAHTPLKILVNVSDIDNIIGKDIDIDVMIKILTSLGFVCNNTSATFFNVEVPRVRHDIKDIADIAEEVLRHIGLDNVELKPLVLKSTNQTNATYERHLLKNQLKNQAVSEGFFECINFAFGNKKQQIKYGFDSFDKARDVANPISSELDTLRSTLVLGLLDVVKLNKSRGYNKIALFELSSVFDSTISENNGQKEQIAFVFSGNKEEASIFNNNQIQKSDFMFFAKKIANIVGEFSLSRLDNINTKISHPYINADIKNKNKETIGQIYKLHPQVSNDYDISEDTFVCVMDIKHLIEGKIHSKSKEDINIKMKDISKYQTCIRDISLSVDDDVSYGTIKQAILNLNLNNLHDFRLINIYKNDSKRNESNLLIRLELLSYEKTLNDDDINLVIDKINQGLDINGVRVNI